MKSNLVNANCFRSLSPIVVLKPATRRQQNPQQSSGGSDRHPLRSELAASKTAQERLHQRYVELGKTILSLLQQFDVTMREATAGKLDSAVGEAANTAKKFDSHGLPLVPQPSANNGAMGTNNGHQLPIEP